MMHSQEMYDQLPIMPQSTCAAILKEIFFLVGEYSGKFTYILFGGVFWAIHIHLGGGIMDT